MNMVHDARDFEGTWMAKEPEQIELSPKEIESLHERIKSFTVTKEDIVLFGKVLSFFVWIQLKLQRSQVTINKLKKIIFGKTEKSTNRSKQDSEKLDKNNDLSDSLCDETDSVSEDIVSNLVEKTTVNLTPSGVNSSSDDPKRKGHGRISADEYVPDEIIPVKHDVLKTGDPCPEKCGGKLYQFQDNPGGIIRIKGRPCVHVVRYEFEKLRCALCGAIFTAEAPADFPPEKYDAHFKANLVMQKYFMASPFYRQERYQKLLGIPLADSTQWDLVESVANCGYPVLRVLERLAANGTHLNHDDTKVKILDVIRSNKLNPDKKRKGTFTTCALAQYDLHKICLYYSGTNHGGENVAAILEKRDKTLLPILRMCDALSANVPATLKTILCHCLTHGRRKFRDIETFFPEECGYVIEQLASVYHFDTITKTKNMSADERLAYHQEHSAPVMESLKAWMQAQFDERKVEPNSALGGAIRYMQKHWVELTQFLSVSGAHIDNNVVERALKLAIRTRKNAMFHKSLHGAFVAGLLLSLIATCELAGKNPVHYLIALQDHKSEAFQHPDQWLPWNYESTLIGLKIAA